MADWLLLIYTLPAQPTRLRAAVWRDLKRAGALYLHDGVAILPATAETTELFEQMTSRIRDQFAGKALLVRAPRFCEEDSASLKASFQEERSQEYRVLLASCFELLKDVVAQAEAERFTMPELERLHTELEHLKRSADQIRGRDYFSAPAAAEVARTLERAGRAVAGFAADVAGGGRRPVSGASEAMLADGPLPPKGASDD